MLIIWCCCGCRSAQPDPTAAVGILPANLEGRNAAWPCGHASGGGGLTGLAVAPPWSAWVLWLTSVVLTEGLPEPGWCVSRLLRIHKDEALLACVRIIIILCCRGDSDIIVAVVSGQNDTPPAEVLLLLPVSNGLPAQNSLTRSSGRPRSPAAPTYRLLFAVKTGDRREFSAVARKRITEVLDAARARQRLQDGEDEELSEGEEDTWVLPLVQMKPLGIRVDEQVTQVRSPQARGQVWRLLVNDKQLLAFSQGLSARFLGNGLIR